VSGQRIEVLWRCDVCRRWPATGEKPSRCRICGNPAGFFPVAHVLDQEETS
jgi:rubrerythrin